MRTHFSDSNSTTTGSAPTGLRALMACVLGVAMALSGTSQAAEYHIDTRIIDEAINLVERKFDDSVRQQEELDRLANASNSLETEFRGENDALEALLVLNAELRASIVRQERQIVQLDEAIAAVEAITRGVPLLTQKMLASIESFIEKDIPFNLDERRRRVEFARDALTNPDVSIAERFRQVLVLYQSEMAAGRTNETYDDTITFDGRDIDVKVVRIGRVALLFQTTDRRITGAWDNDPAVRDWVELPAGDYRTAVQRVIRIAEQLDAPDIIELPVKAPEVVQ